jgi:hypothetical protein
VIYFYLHLWLASNFQFCSILPMKNFNLNPRFRRIFPFGPWFWIYAIWPLIDQQTFNFFNLTPDLVNSSPFIYAPFPIWSLVLNFFNQAPNWPSNFNIYSIKPLIWPNQLSKIVLWPQNLNFFQLKPKLT